MSLLLKKEMALGTDIVGTFFFCVWSTVSLNCQSYQDFQIISFQIKGILLCFYFCCNPVIILFPHLLYLHQCIRVPNTS
jgi:hypothetical protein